MKIYLKDYESCLRPMKERESWELMHEEMGFLNRDEPLYDRELSDLDGQETHMSHTMKGHKIHKQREQKKMHASAR
jgi:hypothetical protein